MYKMGPTSACQKIQTSVFTYIIASWPPTKPVIKIYYKLVCFNTVLTPVYRPALLCISEHIDLPPEFIF